VIRGHWPRTKDETFAGDDAFGDVGRASEALREAAGSGGVTIWGKQHPLRLYELIPAAFWINNQIDQLSVYGSPDEIKTEQITGRPGSEPNYRALKVNKAQVEAVWPARAPAVPLDIPLQVAAQLAYEQAEKEGWLENIAPARGDPQQRLDYFKYAILIQAQNHGITLSGAQPPSTQSYPIPTERIAGLHPMKGENTLHRGSVAGRVEFRDVTINADELDKVIATYHALVIGAR
jgi:hypothetical protein